MAIFTGRAGVLKIDGTAVGDVVGWKLSEKADVKEVWAMGDGAMRAIPGGPSSASGSLEVYCSIGDAGQALLILGAAALVEMYPSGSGTGATFRSVAVLISEISRDVSKDGEVMISVSWIANGPVTADVVA
jgi:hypothetical protein